jgi:hypothetical protein
MISSRLTPGTIFYFLRENEKSRQRSLAETLAAFYSKPRLIGDEWSRWEKSADQACFCTSRWLIRANPICLVPLPNAVGGFMAFLGRSNYSFDRPVK